MVQRQHPLQKTLATTLAVALGLVPAASARTIKAPTSLPAQGGLIVGNAGLAVGGNTAFSAPTLAAPTLSNGISLPIVNSMIATPDAVTPATVVSQKTVAGKTVRSAALPTLTPSFAAPEKMPTRAATAKSVAKMTAQTGNALNAAGPVGDASPNSAHKLGGTLQALLMPGARRTTSGGSVLAAPTAGRWLPLNRPGAVNAADSDGAANSANEVTRRAQIQTLDFVAQTFSAHYAPIEWKRDHFGVEIADLKAKAQRKIERGDPVLSTREYQNVIAEFVGGLKDYHVGIQFFSTEQSMMPFSIMEAKGKYFVTYIDPRMAAAVPFKVGDQIVEFDGQKTGDAVKGLLRDKTGNVARTDKTLATMKLTRRNRQAGDVVPTGTARIKFSGKDGRLQTTEMPWLHMGELVPEDTPARDGGQLLQDFDPFDPSSRPELAERRIQHPALEAIKKIVPNMLNPIAAMLRRGTDDPMAADPFAVGGKESFVPNLGEVLFQLPPQLPIKAYIYKDEKGRHIGYIRISDYVQPEQVADIFGQIIEVFEAKTDALVIDQVNNPGGSVFYLYALLSRLSTKPLIVPKHRTLTGEEEAMQMAPILATESQITSDALAQQVLGPSMGGLPTTLKLYKKIVGYAKFILAELHAGRRLTNEVAMMGVDEIDPHPTQQYTKPIQVLVNELDFSSADFFPAILQDNGRAQIFGTRTSGAGGAVRPTQFPNQFGIAMISYTWSIAMRMIGQVIENLGITPDKPYALTPDDLQNNFRGYKKSQNREMNKLLEGVGPRALEDSILAPQEEQAAAPPATDTPEGPANDGDGNEGGPSTSGPADAE